LVSSDPYDRYKQEAFEKCWAHSQLRAAARRLFYIAIYQVSLLSHAACASMSTTTMTTTITTTTTTRDRGDRYGPTECAQSSESVQNDIFVQKIFAAEVSTACYYRHALGNPARLGRKTYRV